MAQFVFTRGFVSLNGVNLSSFAKGITIDAPVAMEDITTMGNDWTRFLAGMKSWTLSLEFGQDFAANSVDATLWAIYDASVVVPVIIRPNNASVSVTNPQISGNAFITNYSPITGTVGSPSNVSPTFQGDDAFIRATA